MFALTVAAVASPAPLPTSASSASPHPRDQIVLRPSSSPAPDNGLKTGAYVRAYRAFLASDPKEQGANSSVAIGGNIMTIAYAAYGWQRWRAFGSIEYQTLDAFGRDSSVGNMFEANLAYCVHGLLVKVGDQLFSSPWADSHQVFGLPPTPYQGIDAVYSSGRFALEEADITRFLSRNSTTFQADTAIVNGPATSGFSYSRFTYLPSSDASMNAYDYDMRSLVSIEWFDFKQRLRTANWSPYIAMQGGFEHSAGAANLGNVASRIAGAELGVQRGTLDLDVATDDIASSDGARGWVSPYTEGYAADPLYTTGGWEGLPDDRAFGTSYAVFGGDSSGQFRFETSYGWYNQSYIVNPSAWYVNSATASPEKSREWDSLLTYDPERREKNPCGLLYRLAFTHFVSPQGRKDYLRPQVEFTTCR